MDWGKCGAFFFFAVPTILTLMAVVVVLVFYLAEPINLQFVDESIQSRHLRILPRITNEISIYIFLWSSSNIVYITGLIQNGVSCRS